MRVIRKQEPGGERVLALGTFDGVHRGHQKLLETGKAYATGHGIPLRACSFDRHPLEVLCPEKAPKLLTTLAEKTELMQQCQVDELLLMPFTRETADREPEDFLQQLRDSVILRAVVAGWNYTFGKGGRGNAEMLREDGRKHGYRVLIVPPVKDGTGEIISSSLVRSRLQEGKIEDAEKLLGHHYSLRGRVTDGKHMGHRIGMPTANVQTAPSKQLPAFGVYPGIAAIAGHRWAAAVNIGVQPTLPSGRVTVEAHILDDEPDLYGKEIRLMLGNRIRSERKFGSPEELTCQIRKDMEDVRKWIRWSEIGQFAALQGNGRE